MARLAACLVAATATACDAVDSVSPLPAPATLPTQDAVSSPDPALESTDAGIRFVCRSFDREQWSYAIEDVTGGKLLQRIEYPEVATTSNLCPSTLSPDRSKAYLWMGIAEQLVEYDLEQRTARPLLAFPLHPRDMDGKPHALMRPVHRNAGVWVDAEASSLLILASDESRACSYGPPRAPGQDPCWNLDTWLLTIDTAQGEVKRRSLLQAVDGCIRAWDLSPDGATLFTLEGDDANGYRVVARTLESGGLVREGSERVVGPLGRKPWRLEVAPGGGQMLVEYEVQEAGHPVLMGGGVTIFEIDSWDEVASYPIGRSARWSPDGQLVALTEPTKLLVGALADGRWSELCDTDDFLEVWRMAGRHASELEPASEGPYLGQVTWSPTGDRIVVRLSEFRATARFVTGLVQRDSGECKILENVSGELLFIE